MFGSDYLDLLTFYSSHFAITLAISMLASLSFSLHRKKPCILLGELLSGKKMCYYRYHYYSRCNHQELYLFRFCDRATKLDPEESPSDDTKSPRESIEEGASHATLATQNNPSLAQTPLITTQAGGAGIPGSVQHDPSFKDYHQRPHHTHHYRSPPYQSTSSNMASTVSISTSLCLLL